RFPRSLRCLCALVTSVLLLAAGCSSRKAQQPNLREDAVKIAKEKAPPVAFQVTGGRFGITDADGRPVLTARIPNADAVIQPGDPNAGPITLREAVLTLYKEGKPSLWLKAPVTTWQGGLITAAQGGRSGTVDG